MSDDKPPRAPGDPVRPHVSVQILYPLGKPEEFVIKTNVKREHLEEFITNYIEDVHLFKGADPAKAEEHDVYDIKFGLQVGGGSGTNEGGDVWGHENNCGNKGLEVGIIMSVLKLLAVGKGKIE